MRAPSLAKLAAAFVGLLILGSAITLPYSLRWYNVQEFDSAVRQPPSWSPVLPRETYSPNSENLGTKLAHRASSWLGHDDLGRSLLYRLLPGFLVSLGIGGAAATMAMFIGVLWGATAALLGGRTDQLMMRIVDVLYGLHHDCEMWNY